MTMLHEKRTTKSHYIRLYNKTANNYIFTEIETLQICLLIEGLKRGVKVAHGVMINSNA